MTDNELLRKVEALSGVGGFEIDAATRALRWTPQCFALHGLAASAPQPTLEQALGYIDEDDRILWRRCIEAALSEGRPFDLEGTLQPAQGVARRVRVVGAPELVQGRCVSLVCCIKPSAQPLSSALDFAVTAAGIGLWEIDVPSGQEWWSDITLAMYGLPAGAQAPTRTEWRERYLHPDDAAAAAERARDFEATHRPYELDYRIRRADGSQRWLHSRAVFAFGDNRRVLGITLDITERKRAEDRAMEAMLVLDLSSSQVGFGVGYRDVGTDAGFWSQQLKRMFGLAADDPTPTREQFLACVDEADRARVMQVLASHPATGAMQEVEYGMRRPNDGQRRRFISRSVVLQDSASGRERFHFATIDLTELRAKDLQVNELLERLKLTTEASGIGTWERDLQSDVAQWDTTMLALHGLAANAAAPTHEQYLALVHPDDRAALLDDWQRHPNDTAIDYQCRFVMPDGRVRWLQTRGRVQRDVNGRSLRRTGICYDITERHEAEAALQAKALAERANAAKTEFLSRMSHELRTPLNAVLGFAQLMALDASQPLGDKQRERLDHVHTAGWHLLALINDVLDLARIEARQTSLSMGWTPLAPLVEESLTMTAVQAAQRHIEVVYRPAPQVPQQVWADRTRLQQLLLNLVSNAIKYNVEGGEVVVSACMAPNTSTALTASSSAAAELVIAVRDTGMGMTALQLEKLFEPFNRLGREGSQIEGTGIGLALSKLITEQMGGRMEVTSTVGQGSEFRIVLPHPQSQSDSLAPRLQL
jgi:PAS domain S-box-containing protein